MMPSVKQGGIKYHFWVFDMARPRIERDAWNMDELSIYVYIYANNSELARIYIYIYIYSAEAKYGIIF